MSPENRENRHSRRGFLDRLLRRQQPQTEPEQPPIPSLQEIQAMGEREKKQKELENIARSIALKLKQNWDLSEGELNITIAQVEPSEGRSDATKAWQVGFFGSQNQLLDTLIISEREITHTEYQALSLDSGEILPCIFQAQNEVEYAQNVASALTAQRCLPEGELQVAVEEVDPSEGRPDATKAWRVTLSNPQQQFVDSFVITGRQYTHVEYAVDPLESERDIDPTVFVAIDELTEPEQKVLAHIATMATENDYFLDSTRNPISSFGFEDFVRILLLANPKEDGTRLSAEEFLETHKIPIDGIPQLVQKFVNLGIIRHWVNGRYSYRSEIQEYLKKFFSPDESLS